MPKLGDKCKDLGTTSDIHGWDFYFSENGDAPLTGTKVSPRPASKGAGGVPDPGLDELDQLSVAGKFDIAKIRGVRGIVAGVGLRQLPSCSKVSPPQGNTDAFLGYGQSASIDELTRQVPAVFQPNLGKSKTNTTGTPVVPVTPVDLTPPNTTVRVDSWAPLIQ